MWCLCFHLSFLVFLPCVYCFGNIDSCILILVSEEFLLIGCLVMSSLTRDWFAFWVLMLFFQYVIIILMDLILISFLWIAKSSGFLQVESKLGLHFPLLLYLLYVSVAVERSNEPSYRYAEYSFSGVVLMCPWWFKGIIEVLCELVHVEEGYQGQEGISGINVSDFFQHSEPFWSVAVYVIQNSFQCIFNYACGHFGMESEMRL